MNVTEIRAQLMIKRNAILDRVRQLEGDLHARSEPYSAAANERAIEIENLDVLFQIDAATRLELNQINDALERIDAGKYGVCTVCGKKIEKLRLDALPYAETCIHCAV